MTTHKANDQCLALLLQREQMKAGAEWMSPHDNAQGKRSVLGFVSREQMKAGAEWMSPHDNTGRLPWSSQQPEIA